MYGFRTKEIALHDIYNNLRIRLTVSKPMQSRRMNREIEDNTQDNYTGSNTRDIRNTTASEPTVERKTILSS